MSRLVVVSNRVADPRKAAAGGLAVALGDALSATGGMWFGWSGSIAPDGQPSGADVQTPRAGPVRLARVAPPPHDHDTYYRGYANGVLWPVFHYRLDLADFDAGHLDGYCRVNRLFARQLIPLLQPDDIIWVHDYHLIPLADELRALGCRQRIGFFLHIPLPPQLMLAAIPAHRWLMRSLFAYDLVGVQSQADLLHLTRYLTAEAQAEQLASDTFSAFGRVLHAGAFPIGIDVDDFISLSTGREALATMATMREQYAKRHLLVGIDRLDYSKGLPQRVRAFRHLLEHHPENHHQATLVQVAAPSREDVAAYNDIKREMESLCGAINGDFGDFDWMPVRYIHRTVARKRVPGLYRASRVGLVTPLRDGMNLVAKEYVAAQDPADPGVLV
ncbi:MAG: trehalose-6-phosphate synthase, partial [Chitinophagaceae bacterium]|nr:trehalose-6-phosphate synthase [Rubrivivax sp.]